MPGKIGPLKTIGEFESLVYHFTRAFTTKQNLPCYYTNLSSIYVCMDNLMRFAGY